MEENNQDTNINKEVSPEVAEVVTPEVTPEVVAEEVIPKTTGKVETTTAIKTESSKPAEANKYNSSRATHGGQAEKVKAYKKDQKGPSHVIKHRSRITEYGAQLKEKQEVKRAYGVSEKQFANYVKKGQTSIDKSVPPSLRIYLSLESRLDNMVYRAGFAKTRPLARQIVSHGHILVNGKRLDVASHVVRVGDIISIREGSKNTKLFADIKERTKNTLAPDWLKFDVDKLESKIEALPKTIEAGYDFAKIIELYSK